MREILQPVQEWFDKGKKVALATVVHTYGSAPRQFGSKMAVNQDGLMTGSVSGGCVEGAVVAEALDVLKTRMPKLIHYGVTDDLAMSVGLACGGSIDVWVEELSEESFVQYKKDLDEDNLAVVVRLLTGKYIGEQVIAHPDGTQIGTFSDKSIPMLIQPMLLEVFEHQQCLRTTIQIEHEDVEVFFDVLQPSSKLVIVGAVHIAIPLVQMAKLMGFHTTVIDPRKAFANRERFPHVDELILDWPEDYLEDYPWDRGTYLVAISHDDKLDVPALAHGIRSDARYVGALGSKKNFSNHVRDLKAAGCNDEEIARIHSPIGLNIGARGAEEIALSILAELVAVRNGKEIVN